MLPSFRYKIDDYWQLKWGEINQSKRVIDQRDYLMFQIEKLRKEDMMEEINTNDKEEEEDQAKRNFGGRGEKA